MTHWRCTYDPDDGEPIGEACDCEIGDDHNGKGEPAGITFTTAARGETSALTRNGNRQHSFSPYALCRNCGIPFALAAGPCSPGQGGADGPSRLGMACHSMFVVPCKKSTRTKGGETIVDAHETGQALRRLKDLWYPWYEIKYDDGLWSAVRLDRDVKPITAITPEFLNARVIRDYMNGRRLGRMEHADAAEEAALADVRRKYCIMWDYIGPDPETGGWRASRTISPGVTHHVATRTIGELDIELAALETPDPDDDKAPVS